MLVFTSLFIMLRLYLHQTSCNLQLFVLLGMRSVCNFSSVYASSIKDRLSLVVASAGILIAMQDFLFSSMFHGSVPPCQE